MVVNNRMRAAERAATSGGAATARSPGKWSPGIDAFRASPTTRDSSPEGLVEIWRPKRYEVGASCPSTPNSVRHRSRVRFPAESHELTRSGSPVHRVMRFEILLDWFDRYLKDGLIGLFRGRLPGRQPPALSPVT